MNTSLQSWLPAAILALGFVLAQVRPQQIVGQVRRATPAAAVTMVPGVQAQERMPLARPLDSSIPRSIEAFRATDLEIPEEERLVAGMDAYIMRVYQNDAGAAFSLYVGYYENQVDGEGIHTPRRCLPGAGWEPVSSRVTQLTVAGVAVPVNEYVLRRGDQRALAVYWYQGRGRVVASDLKGAWHLFRDAALLGRTEEALVRIVVPITPEDDGTALAYRMATAIIPAMDQALPRVD